LGLKDFRFDGGMDFRNYNFRIDGMVALRSWTLTLIPRVEGRMISLINKSTVQDVG
jgi:hypothetical protein